MKCTIILLACLFFAAPSAWARDRQQLLPDNEFKYPRDCDDKKLPCLYSVAWMKTEDQQNVNFIWKAKLDMDQWVGLTWIKGVSLVDANVLTLTVLRDEKEKDLKKQIVPQLMIGEMSRNGVIIPDEKQPEFKNLTITLDQETHMVVARFTRPLTPLHPGGDDELAKCPIWVMLPDASPVVAMPVEGGMQKQHSIAQLHMKMTEGSLFYLLNPKCLSASS